MSSKSIENDFKTVFQTIYEISEFLNEPDVNCFNVNEIRQIFNAACYVEKLVSGLKEKELENIFICKLNSFLNLKGKLFYLSLEQLERYCDEVLNKIIIAKPPTDILSKAIEDYLNFCNYERFEALFQKLSDFRKLFIQLSHLWKNYIPSNEIKVEILVQSWLKFLDYNADGQNDIEIILQKIFTDITNIESVIHILLLESSQSNSIIQNILMNVIKCEVSSSPCLASWKYMVKSKHFIIIVKAFPQILEPLLVTLEFLECRYQYEIESKSWHSPYPDDIEYTTFIDILKTFYNLKETHYKIKKFIRIQEMKGNKELWAQFQNMYLQPIKV